MSDSAKTQNGKSPEEESDKRSAARLVLESLLVKSDRIVAKVRVGNPADAFTTPELAGRLVRIRPDLPIHTCVNGRGPTFGAVLANTPLPHVLEHVVIDLQAAECENADYVFTGVTRWVDRRAGKAQVEVSYADDIAGIRAFRDATELINSL